MTEFNSCFLVFIHLFVLLFILFLIYLYHLMPYLIFVNFTCALAGEPIPHSQSMLVHLFQVFLVSYFYVFLCSVQVAVVHFDYLVLCLVEVCSKP